MKLLFIVPYVPSLVRVRPYNLLHSLVKQGHDLTLLTLYTNPAELEDANRLREWGMQVEALPLPRIRSLSNSLLALPTASPLQSAYCWQPDLARRLAQLTNDGLNPFDAVHVEHLRGARYGLAVKAAAGGSLPVIWDSVDSISMLFRQAVTHSRSLFGKFLTRLELGRTEHYEAWLASQFDRVLVTSENDRRAFTSLNGFSADLSPEHISVVPNGVDLEYFTPDPAVSPEPDSIVITGKMSYHANVTMVLYLVEQILPKVWARRPAAKLVIVGKDPPREILALADNPSIVVTGTVPDIRPYLRRAAVAAVPLTYGAGIQNKVLEAMACGTPVVSTPQAVSALQVVPDQDLLVAASPEEFAQALVNVLEDTSRRLELGAGGRRYVETQHRWDTIVAHLEEIYLQAKNHPKKLTTKNRNVGKISMNRSAGS